MEKEKEKENKRKKVLCEDEYFILDALHYVGAEGNDALGPLLLLNQDKGKKLAHAKKLRKYIEFKGKYITQQNILSKIKIRHPFRDAFSFCLCCIISRIRSPDHKCELCRLPECPLLPVLR